MYICTVIVNVRDGARTMSPVLSSQGGLPCYLAAVPKQRRCFKENGCMCRGVRPPHCTDTAKSYCFIFVKTALHFCNMIGIHCRAMLIIIVSSCYSHLAAVAHKTLHIRDNPPDVAAVRSVGYILKPNHLKTSITKSVLHIFLK